MLSIYTFSAKNAAADVQELVVQREEGTVPIIDKRETGTFKWKRVGKRWFLIHTVRTVEYGGQGGKVTGRSKRRSVYEITTCVFDELSKAKVMKIRRLRGGRKIPLPISGY